jgi:hypothetical protein
MNFNLLSKISSAVVALAVSSAAFAALDMESRVTQLEKQMQQVRTETPADTFGAKTALGRPAVDGHGFFVTLNALYWQPKTGGTEYAYTDQDTQGAYPRKGRVKTMDFDWDYGFRVGVGYNLDHDGWDTHLQYTWLDSSGSSSTRAGSNSSVIPLKSSWEIADNSSLVAESAKSMYDFDYQSLTLELGRDFYLSKKLSVHPHVGLKSTWLDLTQSVRYTGRELEGNTLHVDDYADFWGLGPRFGFDSKWYVGNGFSLFGKLSGALIYGYHDVDHKEKMSNNPDVRKIHLHANKHGFAPNANMQLGVRYDTYVNDNKQHVSLGLAFEAEYYFKINQMLQIRDQSNDTFNRPGYEASMHGLTLDFKFDF